MVYLENRQGGGAAPGWRTLLPKGHAVDRAPPVPREIFIELVLGKQLR